jgi:hypothetical protein
MLLTNPQITIADETTAVTLTVQRDLESDFPVTLIVDDSPFSLTLDEAVKLARAGQRIKKALFKSKEAPKEAAVFFPYKIAFPDGTVAAFELGVAADPIGLASVAQKADRPWRRSMRHAVVCLGAHRRGCRRHAPRVG